MPTFLHTADIHLDTAFSARFDARQAELRRNEMLRCMSDVVDRAKNLDLLLIAGDLFDSAFVSPGTIGFLKRKFAEIPNTHIFIAAGNHDPYTSDSIYSRENLGENVHVFSVGGECVELPEIKTRVFGASFDGQFCRETLWLPVIEKTDGVTDILVLHADLTANGAQSDYNPITADFLEHSGADYAALGHIHKRSEVQRRGRTYYAYSGIPEGRGFDECGDMGCYVGEISNGAVNVKFESFCCRKMLRIDADISGAADNLQAAELAAAAMNELGGSGDMYKVTLTGRVTPGLVNVEIIKEELAKNAFYIEVCNETRADFDIDSIAEQNTLCGEFVRLMQKKIAAAESGEKKILEDAMLLGTEALLGGEAP